MYHMDAHIGKGQTGFTLCHYLIMFDVLIPSFFITGVFGASKYNLPLKFPYDTINLFEIF